MPPNTYDESDLDELWGRAEHLIHEPEPHALAEVSRIMLKPGLYQPKYERLSRLVFDVASTFEACAKRPVVRSVFDMRSATVMLEERSGRVRLAISDPYRDFVSALDGAEVDRIRRCPICEKFFYARRAIQRACSKRCNQTRRVRAWRSKQAVYEQNRKFKRAGIRPEGE